LTEKQVRLIEKYAGPELTRLGYSLLDQTPEMESQRNSVLA
jgi:hypothetical protein